VNIDYHVEVDRHYYSVPYQLAGQRCDVRLTTHAVEVILRGRRVASHRRSFVRGRHATDPAHMPEAHRRHLEWTPSRIIRVGGYKRARPPPSWHHAAVSENGGGSPRRVDRIR
jgi:transposase